MQSQKTLELYRKRPDHDGTHRKAFERNKKIIYATQTICALCGTPVDFTRKYPDPLSPSVDHIIPIDKGGHPSDLQNLQLAHFGCNCKKGKKIVPKAEPKKAKPNALPLSADWTTF